MRAQGELVVAGVFVRVYNEQPTFPVADPAAFCKGLVTYLHAQTQAPEPPPAAAPAAGGALHSPSCVPACGCLVLHFMAKSGHISL